MEVVSRYEGVFKNLFLYYLYASNVTVNNALQYY